MDFIEEHKTLIAIIAALLIGSIGMAAYSSHRSAQVKREAEELQARMELEKQEAEKKAQQEIARIEADRKEAEQEIENPDANPNTSDKEVIVPSTACPTAWMPNAGKKNTANSASATSRNTVNACRPARMNGRPPAPGGNWKPNGVKWNTGRTWIAIATDRSP